MDMTPEDKMTQVLELTNNESSKREMFARIWHWTGFQEKKLWDILQLLMPLIIAIAGTIIFQWAMKERDLKIANDRANQEALIAYFDQTASLLFEHNLRTSQVGDEARIVARARTLAALRELDGERKSQLVKFLVEAELITGKTSVIKLSNANLSNVDLRGRNLQGAIIPWANLDQADLGGADFRAADLNHTSLCKANLRGVNFDHTNLDHAILNGADLQGVSLATASLHEVSFLQTNLAHAKLNSNALETAVFCRTTMPDSTRSDRDCSKLKAHRFKGC
jgi:uncharacterized protein YjbI with pentapeptide repeats